MNIDLDKYREVVKKIEKSTYHSVDPNLKEAFAAELDDLEQKDCKNQVITSTNRSFVRFLQNII